MNAPSRLQADGQEIARFAEALFRYAEEGTVVSLRAFYDCKDGVFAVESHAITADTGALAEAATRLANRCAAADAPVVFCPPIATFSDARNATEKNLANGLALSVECDQKPATARAKLESLLGPATVIVASGGEWTDPETGEVQDKLHLHWRLNEPTRDAEGHVLLKLARTLATRLVGGDASNKPVVHPIRWPGSWHRKASPRLARIVSLTDREIDLQDALERLQDAVGAMPSETASTASSGEPGGEERQTAELVRAVLTAEDYHAPLVALAMRYLQGGMPDAQAVLTLRGLMLAVPEASRDMKDDTAQPGRWQARFDDIPRAVRTAREKIGAAAQDAKQAGGLDALDFSRFRLDVLTEGAPPPQRFLLAPLMPLGVVGLLFGPGGVGKSLAALDLCMLVAERGRITGTVNHVTGPLGGIVPPEAAGASVFLTLEDSKDELHRRTATLDPEGRRKDLPCYVLPAIELPDFDPALVRTEGRTAALTAFAREGLDRLLGNIARGTGKPVRLLVLDPAGDFMDADENAAEAVKPLMRCLRGIAQRHGCTILLLGHVAKGMDGDAPSMRGSGAWVANSRFAYALWQPKKDEAESHARKLGCAPGAVVCGNLVKANHAGAPVNVQRWFRRDATGRLIDTTPAAPDRGHDDAALLALLVHACGEAAAAGLPFTVTGLPGLYQGRADLPGELAELSKARLEALGNAALAARRLVKARNNQAQGTTKYLDLPDGPLARGEAVEMVMGSRRAALARYRAKKAAAGAAPSGDGEALEDDAPAVAEGPVADAA